MWGATTATALCEIFGIVSIHAPRVGRDRDERIHCTTHLVSIHAPRVGRDGFPVCRSYRRAVSIHAPRVGRDFTAFAEELQEDVSIHAPRVGRDALLSPLRPPRTVSIHAPRVGRDRRSTPNPSKIWCFNPRAPCGARQCLKQKRGSPYWFQSTRPVWGATATGVTTSPFCHVFMGIPLHKYDFLGT